MTTQIEKLRAELEEKTRKFLEDGGKIDERRAGEATIGTHNDRDLRAETMTLEEVASASGLAKEYIKSLAYQKKMPQAAVYLDCTVLPNTGLKFRHLRWRRSEIEAWLTKLAENKKQQRAARIERMRKINTCSAERPEGALWISEVAELIGVTPNTVRNRANKGRFRKPDGYVGVKPFWYAKKHKITNQAS